MSGMDDLRTMLRNGFRIERHPGTPVVAADVTGAVPVVSVMAYPESPPGATRADVHFAVIAPTEGAPDRGDFIAAVRAATAGHGEFVDLTATDLSGGPSYITLGGWLGSQDLALLLIGATGLLGIAEPITPAMLGLTGADADHAAGMGMIMLGPTTAWTNDHEETPS